MGWETRKSGGRYYTRSKRVGGKVVREYVGSGKVGELAEQLDEIQRTNRQLARKSAADPQIADLGLGASKILEDFDALADRIGRALMISAGFHQHKRGNWRRRRGNERNEKERK